MADIDVRQLPRNEQLFLASGVAVFIASFLPWYGYSFSVRVAGFGASGGGSITAWHGWALIGILLIVAATVVAAMQRWWAQSLPRVTVSWNVVVTGLSALGALLIVIRSLDLPSASVPGGNVGLRWGGWVLIIVSIVNAIAAVLRLRATGEPMPWHDAVAQPPAA